MGSWLSDVSVYGNSFSASRSVCGNAEYHDRSIKRRRVTPLRQEAMRGKESILTPRHTTALVTFLLLRKAPQFRLIIIERI